MLGGFRAVAAWAEAHWGIPAGQSESELRHLFDAGVRGDTFDRWLRAHDRASGDRALRLVEVYRGHQPVLSPYPEVRTVLGVLGASFRLGLVTDGYLEVQRRKLAALGLAHYFAQVVFSDELGPSAWKPSSRPFEVILRRLATDAAQAVYVGDNPLKDFVGARKVGMFTVQVQRTGGEYSDLSPPTPQHAPHALVQSLSELSSVLSEDC